MKKGNSGQEQSEKDKSEKGNSEKGQFWKENNWKRTILNNGILKKGNRGKGQTKKGQFWKGRIRKRIQNNEKGQFWEGRTEQRQSGKQQTENWHFWKGETRQKQILNRKNWKRTTLKRKNRKWEPWFRTVASRGVGRPVKRWRDDIVSLVGEDWPTIARDTDLWKCLRDGYVNKLWGFGFLAGVCSQAHLRSLLPSFLPSFLPNISLLIIICERKNKQLLFAFKSTRWLSIYLLDRHILHLDEFPSLHPLGGPYHGRIGPRGSKRSLRIQKNSVSFKPACP